MNSVFTLANGLKMPALGLGTCKYHYLLYICIQLKNWNFENSIIQH